MRKFMLNKLVRDGIVADMEVKGQQVVSLHLGTHAFYIETGRKVLEETTELNPDGARDDIIKELADRKEAELAAKAAREALAAEVGISEAEVEAVRLAQLKKRGGFESCTYIESVSMADDDPWAAYYANEPDRFTEVKE